MTFTGADVSATLGRLVTKIKGTNVTIDDGGYDDAGDWKVTLTGVEGGRAKGTFSGTFTTVKGSGPATIKASGSFLVDIL